MVECNQTTWLISCSVFITILITSIVLFACSFGIVELNEWGIVFDKNVQEIEGKPFGSGRYLVGLGRKFIIFPRTLVFIESRTDSLSANTDTLSCWTKDGINVYVEMNFYFKLEPNKLKDMYLEFGDDWFGSLVRLAQTSVMESTTNFLTQDFFTKRDEIDGYMSKQIQIRFNTFVPDTLKIIEFNLRNFYFDEPYENAINAKLIQYQQKKTYEIIQTTAQILKETEYLEFQAKNNITMIYAQSSAKGSILKAKAESNAFNNLIKKQADLYKGLMNTLELNQKQILQFIYADSIGENQNHFLVGPNNNIILNSK